MQRDFEFSVGEYYHAYNRGVEKRKIFLSKDDYRRFVRLLYAANGTRSFVYREIENKKFSDIRRGSQLVAIGAWVLMPNHFHLLLKETVNGGISLFMQKLLTGYSSYFNKRHDRVGGLFQGVFQAQHADTDDYLRYLFAYIHLNPVKLIEPEWKERGIRNRNAVWKFLKEYDKSSFADYTEATREESRILSKDEFPQYFVKRGDFGRLVEDLLLFETSSATGT